MWKSRLKPREFRFRAGARTELDQAFLKIISNLPEEINLSEYIKSSVVENELRKQEISEADRVLTKFQEFFEATQMLKLNLNHLKLEAIESKKAEQLTKIADLLNYIEHQVKVDFGDSNEQ